MPMALHDRIENILNLSRAADRALKGDASQVGAVQILPSSPFSDQNDEISEDTPTDPQLDEWLAN
jgi:hypothetical protein